MKTHHINSKDCMTPAERNELLRMEDVPIVKGLPPMGPHGFLRFLYGLEIAFLVILFIELICPTGG